VNSEKDVPEAQVDETPVDTPSDSHSPSVATDGAVQSESNHADHPMTSTEPTSDTPLLGTQPHVSIRRRPRWSLIALGLVAIIAALGVIIRPAKVIMTPGNADSVAQSLVIEGADTYSHRGSLLYLTVLVTNQRPTLFELGAAYLDDDAKVFDEKDILGDQTRKESDDIDRALMTESQSAAKIAALTRLGYTVTVSGSGALVREVVPGTPADGALVRGDIIEAVDGTPIATSDALVAAVREKPVGTTFVLTVRSGPAERAVNITSGMGTEGKPIIGIATLTADPQYGYPFNVTIDTGQVSGPSAGLAFTLGIIDELTPGELTGGKKIAVTGTITASGLVGEVGGVEQKAIAAQRAGATTMLVPASEVDLARRADTKLKIIGVTTLDDALAALADNGGTPIPPRS
jgi:PDZ domain-containing protein